MLKPIFFTAVLCLSAPVWAQNPVTVRVVDDKNAPVVGATVEVFSWVEGAKPIPGALTDATGAAKISLPSTPDGKRAGAVVEVVAPGFAFGGAPVTGEAVEIRLEKGALWRGKVLDEVGKPIAGAKIKMSGAMKEGDWTSHVFLRSEKSRARYSAQSGADGSFQIADVPAKLVLMYSVEHPKYARGRGQNALASTEEEVRLAPGASVTGRLLDDKGAPLVKTRVFAQPVGGGEGYGEAQSDDAGNFQIDGLAAGNYNLLVQLADNAQFIVPAATNVTAVPRETLPIAPLRGVPGVLVRGVVRDAATKKPIAGAGIGLYGPHRPASSGAITSTSTKEDGRFEMRAVPGQNRFYLYGAPQGYLAGQGREQKNISVGAPSPGDLVFELKKATVLRGKITDEAGKPLQIKLKIGYDSFIQSDAKGEWKYTPHDDQALQLAGSDAEDGYYEVVSPLSIEVGAAEETTVVLRQKPWQVLPGRALSSEGKPLEGAQISFDFYTSMGDGNGALNTSNRTAISNANGDFVLPRIRDGIKAGFFKISGKKAGFAFQKGGELSKNGPIWQVSDFIFTPLNLKIEGKTAPGARVTAAGTEIVADAGGQFSFAGLATGAQVYAFKAGQFGGGEAKNPLQIELKTLQPQARDAALAREIWAEVSREAALTLRGKTYSRLGWVESRLAGGGQPSFAADSQKASGDMAILRLVSDWATKTDAQALEKALSRIADPDIRLYGFLDAAAKTGDPILGARALKEAEAVLQTPEKEAWWREMNLYRAAAMTSKFAGEAAGFAALDQAVAYTLKNHGPSSTRQGGMPGQTGRDEMFALQAEVVAEGGLPLIRRLISQIEPGAGYEVRALGEAIPILAKTDPESVLPLFEELSKMPEPVKRDEGHAYGPATAFARAGAKVVRWLGAKSPEKALQLARRVEGDEFSGTRSQALADAARFQNGASAARLWREAVTAAPTEMAPRFAARAWEVDRDLGRELFEIVLQKVESETKSEWRSREVWPNFAFYFARVDAAQARFVLEREWGAATQKKSESELLGALAFAMSAIDARRAAIMAQSIAPDERHTSFEARRKIGQYLSLSEATRRDYPFSNRDYEAIRELDAQ